MLSEPRPACLPEPLCDETEFAELIEEMVADEAPRLFAIVQEYGERVDARLAGWGMWFGDRAVAFDVSGRTMIMSTVESTLRLFRANPLVTPRAYWTGPEPSTVNQPGPPS